MNETQTADVEAVEDFEEMLFTTRRSLASALSMYGALQPLQLVCSNTIVWGES